MWKSKWPTLRVRIDSILEAGAYFRRSTGDSQNDEYGTGPVLLRHAQAVGEEIKLLSKCDTLPDSALACVKRFEAEWDDVVQYAVGGLATPQLLTRLALFRGEFTQLMADTEAVGRSLVARAFAHLQRSIVADLEIRKKWEAAFESGETDCEKLGACHLLLHGIWAFKVDAAGERTDLVLSRPLDPGESQAAAEVLTLTEWKKVDEGKQEAKAEEAYKQAKLYSAGSLYGVELELTRYLVLVSKDYLPPLEPRRDGKYVYHHINVAVTPSRPSDAARR